MSKPIHTHEGAKYLREIHGPYSTPGDKQAIQVDVYAVLEAFGVTCPARAHCIKKLLCCGNRGNGSELDDLIGAEAALSRAVELQKQRESWDGEAIPTEKELIEDLKELIKNPEEYSTQNHFQDDEEDE